MSPGDDWHLVARTDDVEAGAPRRVIVDGVAVALFRVNGDFFATEDRCSHAQASLSEGYQEGDEIECPMHSGRFHIPTGEAVARPARKPVRTFPVRIEGDGVFVQAAPGGSDE